MPKVVVFSIGWIVIGVLLLNAPAGIVIVILPSGEVTEPPVEPISFVCALPTGVPIAVGNGVTVSVVGCLTALSFLQALSKQSVIRKVADKSRFNFRCIIVFFLW